MKTKVSGTAVIMADQLSDKTGSRFTVRRRPIRPPEQRYYLEVEREGLTWTFWHQGLTYHQMSLTLASFLDMIEMGFVRVQ